MTLARSATRRKKKVLIPINNQYFFPITPPNILSKAT